MKKTGLLIFIFSFLIFNIFSLSNPRIAVIPFNAVGISENEAIIASELFETALVQTESYEVIEQNQIEEILDAQSYSLSGCTSDSCAVEIGKLLSAEQIVLGTFSRLGSGYIINVKIINVTLGRNIRADKVSLTSMDELSESADLLAHKLAGLVYQSGGVVTIADSFGEIFISTVPSEADIYVNGIKKGISPDLFSRVPLGSIRIEARKDGLYASTDINIESGTSEVSLELKEVYGNLFIKSTEEDVEVFLDGRNLGPLNGGFFRDLPAGEHQLTVRNDNSFWEEKITITEDESIRVEAFPRPFGVIHFNIPEACTAEIHNSTYDKTITGEGKIQIWTGAYDVRIFGDIYKTKNIEIIIEHGEITELTPELELTPEGKIVLKERTYESFFSRVEELERQLDTVSAMDIIALIDEIKILKADISGGSHSFPDLALRVEEVESSAEQHRIELTDNSRLKELKDELVELEKEYETLQAKNGRRNRLKYIFGGLGIGSFGGCGATWYLENEAYTNYENANSTASAMDYREQSENLNIAKISTGAAGLVFSALSAVFWIGRDDGIKLQNRIDETSRQIKELESQI